MDKADIFSKVCCTQSLINFIANCPPRVLLPSLLRITNLAKCSSGGRVWKFRDFARIRPLSLAATLHLRSNINFSLHIFATEILGHIFNNFNQIHVGSFLRNKQLNFFESINSKSLYVQWQFPSRIFTHVSSLLAQRWSLCYCLFDLLRTCLSWVLTCTQVG